VSANNEQFCHVLRVRYGECDGQKVVFNARYVDYIDVVSTEFTRAVWGQPEEVFTRGVDYQVVNVTVNWKASAHFDDVLAIYVSTQRIGSSSFTLQFDFYRHGTEEFLARGEVTYVMVSLHEHTKVAIPDDMKEALQHGAPGVIVDCAGSRG